MRVSQNLAVQPKKNEFDVVQKCETVCTFLCKNKDDLTVKVWTFRLVAVCALFG